MWSLALHTISAPFLGVPQRAVHVAAAEEREPVIVWQARVESSLGQTEALEPVLVPVPVRPSPPAPPPRFEALAVELPPDARLPEPKLPEAAFGLRSAPPAVTPAPPDAARTPTPRELAQRLPRRPATEPFAATEPSPADARSVAQPAPLATTESAMPAHEARPEVLSPLAGHNPQPAYPEPARRRGIEGVVVVRITVGPDGNTSACEVAVSSGSVVLDAAALAAARRWRFDRGPGVVEQPFRFTLDAR